MSAAKWLECSFQIWAPSGKLPSRMVRWSRWFKVLIINLTTYFRLNSPSPFLAPPRKTNRYSKYFILSLSLLTALIDRCIVSISILYIYLFICYFLLSSLIATQLFSTLIWIFRPLEGSVLFLLLPITWFFPLACWFYVSLLLLVLFQLQLQNWIELN